MSNNLSGFRNEFLNANSWSQRKDGVPLDLLDKLSPEELKIAEKELIKILSPGDTWPIIGLGHIKSKDALPKLYKMLEESNESLKVTIAHSIYQICGDPKMIDIALEEMPKITSEFKIIDLIYLLPDFNDERIEKMLYAFRDGKEFLLAYNATRALGLPTEEIVDKFQKK